MEIPDAALDEVWRIVADLESYPATMPDVLSVRYLERRDNVARSEWCVLLNGSELSWIEHDVFEPMSAIHFCQIEGDLEIFRGSWRLERMRRGVRIELRTEFDIGIPSLAEVLNPIGIHAIQANSHQMLSSICGRAVARNSPIQRSAP